MSMPGRGFSMVVLAVAALAATTQLFADTKVFTNARVATQTTAGTLEAATVVVTDGKVVYAGAEADAPQFSDAETLDANGRWLTPGLIASNTQLGIVEISAEASSADARVVDFRMGPAFDVRYALNPSSILMGTSRAAGITSAVVAPQIGNDLFAGLGAAIRLTETLDPANSLISSELAMFASITSRPAGMVGGSRSALLVRLRNALTQAKRYSAGRYSADDHGYSGADMAALKRWLASGKPLAVEANQAAQILQAIALARDFKFPLVITGGVEAWKVATQLAAAEVPVVLDPLNNIPVDFDALGARLDNASLLHKAGVEIVFVSENSHNLGWIRQGGGVAVANGLPWDAALAALTSAPARIWGLAGRGRIERGAIADLVLWSGDPLEVTTHAERVMIEGKWVSTDNRQERLLERYRDLSNTVTPYGYR